MENGRLFYSPGLSVSFQPENLKVFQESIAHPAPLLGEWGSFSSELLLDFSKQIFQRKDLLIFEYLGKEFSISKEK
nr:Uncharacterized protein A9P81_0726 [Leptospira interrogans serovar Copenhageni/Icterohaemorrhagiae]